nr:PREDICTED: uncharacterized protein LOC105663545 [Megachile rotundata]XP_012148499.1 PREDICTED: uncharacterized protein LOC105663545 [Megachile rotundata]XP_012148500.1 PREDICTED: uncharacterized protein LOC105663545 [Megachile rotundata]XP_012148501.1 PREDICTED: uncharacterized protein LOC105663545 [Megachile rotundata]
MLRFLTIIKWLFICTITFKLANTKELQRYHVHFTPEEDMSKMEVPTEFHTFSNQTSLKMLDDITAKVWKILPVIDVPKSWVLAYCTKNTEITEQVEKASMQCQHDGTDWDCTFIELGGGQDDFNMGKIVSLINSISNQKLRSKLLRAAEICSKLWQRYKRAQDRRLTRMRLNVHVSQWIIISCLISSMLNCNSD